MLLRVCGWMAVLAALASPARAEPHRLAIVLGFGDYTTLPKLPICPRSADAVGTALQKLGFDVTAVRDASNGAASAALAAFARRLADPPDFAIIYACGYVTGFDGRPFLLPVSAELARPGDVMTQGMLAKTLIDLPRAGSYPALVILDAVAAPGSGPNGLGGLVHAEGRRENLFVAGATTPDPSTPATALSAALVAALGAPNADAAGVLASLQSSLDASASLATAGSAPQKALLTPLPAPPPPQAPPPPPQATQPAPVASLPPPQAPGPPILDESERRRIQAALKQLGLYPGPVDGIVGLATTAAIRRFQTVRGVDPTGQLDSAQATLLLALVPKPP